MKVLWFSNTPANASEYLLNGPMGGGWLQSLDKTLQEKVCLHIAFYYPKRDSSFKYLLTTYHPIRRKNWKFHALIGMFRKTFVDVQDLDDYLRIIDLVKPDIIHIHGTENPFGCIIGKTMIPVVTSIQGNMTVYLHKYCSGIECKYLSTFRTLRTQIKNLSFASNFKKDYLMLKKMQEREERNFKNLRNIIGRTDWDKRITSVLAPGGKYFHGDEILRESFYITRWTPHNRIDQIVVHTTNRDNYYKGFETICQTLYELNKLKINVKWQVAGIKSDSLIVKVARKKLKNKYPDHGLIFLGSLSEQLLIERLLEADIYIMPSHIENSPNNLCEAMMIGMPCISTFVGGTGSLMKDREDGILIQDGDPWAMAGAILELHNNRSLAIRYGVSAREKALLRHDKTKVTNDLVETYMAIINDKG